MPVSNFLTFFIDTLPRNSAHLFVIIITTDPFVSNLLMNSPLLQVRIKITLKRINNLESQPRNKTEDKSFQNRNYDLCTGSYDGNFPEFITKMPDTKLANTKHVAWITYNKFSI